MAVYVYPPVVTTITGVATEAKQDDAIALLTTIDADTSIIAVDTTSIDGKITACDTGAVVISSGSISVNAIAPIDFLDSGIVDSSSTNIPAAGLQVVASLAADVKEIEILEDIGEYMTLTDGADAVLAYLPLGGGRVKVSVAAATALKLASVSGSTISVGKIAINFLG